MVVCDTAMVKYLLENSFVQEQDKEDIREAVAKVEEADRYDYHIELLKDGTFSWCIESKDRDTSEIYVSNREVGLNLMMWREYHGMTQAEVGRKIGCSQQAYQKYEKGLRSVPIDLLAKLSRLFGVSMEQIVYPVRGLKDMPQYKPYAQLHGIRVVEVSAYDGCRTITNKELPMTYGKLYGILEGRNRVYIAIGYATAVNGEAILLVERSNYDEIVSKLDFLERDNYYAYLGEEAHYAEMQLRGLDFPHQRYLPNGGSQKIEYEADGAAQAAANLARLCDDIEKRLEQTIAKLVRLGDDAENGMCGEETI